MQKQLVRRSGLARRSVLAAFLVCLIGLLALGGAVDGHLVIFKDGFTLQGKISRESTSFVDPATGQFLQAAKLGGFYMVDDEARRTMFSVTQVQDADKKDNGPGADPLRFSRPFTRLDRFRIPSGSYVGVTQFDDNWDRVATIDPGTGQGKYKIAQHLSILTPHFARVDARRHNWNAYYLTTELDPAVVRKLLLAHPEMKKADEPTRRLRLSSFMLQAGWYDLALAELDGVLKEFPAQRDKVEPRREELKKIVLSRLVDMIERANKVGQHQWAQLRLLTIPQTGVDEALLVRVRALQNTYDMLNKNLALAGRLLEDLPAQVKEPTQRPLFADAVAVLQRDLNVDTVNRLETFVGFAQQAERERAKGQAPAHAPEQLLALAISGWVLGNNAAEAKAETGLRLWRTRQFLMAYQGASGPSERSRLAAAFETAAGLAYDELTQVLRSLPPSDPIELQALGKETMALGLLPLPPSSLYWVFAGAYSASPFARFELQADLPESFRRGPRYVVQLPPEYHHGRSYPVLFLLHQVGDKPEDMLRFYSPQAALNGYVLVAPEWDRGIKPPEYHYTAEEQAAVFDVLVDLRRRLQVDSDRVFVAGLGDGGNMAYDVGLSRPDLFAGILPMGGRPRFFARHYWHNAQYLPFYVVEGDLDASSTRDNREMFEKWIPRGYPTMLVQYKGRGGEWFGGELPAMFDWMNRKKRYAGFPELGRPGLGGINGDEFQTSRPSDKQFYWLTGEQMQDRFINDIRRWSNRITPAYLQARISEGNQITVSLHGFKKCVVWLGPGMIDFDKPVSVSVNGRLAWTNKKVTPSLRTLLDEFFEHGDRQRLFYAKLELSP